MKHHRKIQHNEEVCLAQDLGSYSQGQGHNQVRGQNCFSNNSKTTKAVKTKLHRKIEHKKKVCRAQELSSYAQGQGDSQVNDQSCLINNSKTTRNFSER